MVSLDMISEDAQKEITKIKLELTHSNLLIKSLRSENDALGLRVHKLQVEADEMRKGYYKELHGYKSAVSGKMK